MSDWLLTALPIGVVIYFLIYPAQFALVLNWMSGLVQ